MSEDEKFVNLKVDKVSTKKRDKVEKFALMKMNIMPSHPFRLAVCGSSGSGKSSLLVNLLITRYEHYDTCDEEEIERILHEQREDIIEIGLDKAPKLLVIFDDCIAEKNIGSNTIKKLFTQGRHYNASVAILSQSYMRIPRDIRLQLSHLCIFLPNQSECQRIAEEQQNLYCDAKRLENIIYQACKEKHSFLFINKQANPHEWYRKRFDEIFIM